MWFNDAIKCPYDLFTSQSVAHIPFQLYKPEINLLKKYLFEPIAWLCQLRYISILAFNWIFLSDDVGYQWSGNYFNSHTYYIIACDSNIFLSAFP